MKNTEKIVQDLRDELECLMGNLEKALDNMGIVDEEEHYEVAVCSECTHFFMGNCVLSREFRCVRSKSLNDIPEDFFVRRVEVKG